MTSAIELWRELSAELRPRLERLDLEYCKRGIYRLPLSDSIWGWLAIAETVFRGEGIIHVSANVGIRHDEVEAAVAQLKHTNLDPCVPPTSSTSLDDLRGDRQYKPWVFTCGQDTAAELDRLTGAIATTALPFFKRHADLASIIQLLEAGVGLPGQLEVRLATAYRMAGRQHEAQAYLSGRLAELDGRSDAVARRFREFVVEFGRQ